MIKHLIKESLGFFTSVSVTIDLLTDLSSEFDFSMTPLRVTLQGTLFLLVYSHLLIVVNYFHFITKNLLAISFATVLHFFVS